MPYLYIDPLKCTGCRICELSCAFQFFKVLNPMKSRLRVVRLEPSIDVPVSCKHCVEPPCLEACPVGAISKREKTGLVLVNKNKCIGCRSCLDACPYGVMYFDPDGKTAINCVLCGFCEKKCPVEALFIHKGEWKDF